MDTSGRTIGELARDSGVHVETIRYYERRGLLRQPPRGGGWRRYGEDAVRVLHFVKRGQELGFSLDEVQELLALRVSPSRRAAARARAAAEAKLADVEAKIRDLEAIREALNALARRCTGEGSGDTCPILSALDGARGRADD